MGFNSGFKGLICKSRVRSHNNYLVVNLFFTNDSLSITLRCKQPGLFQLHILVLSFPRSSSFSSSLYLILHNAFRFCILSPFILCEWFVHFYCVHFLVCSYLISFSSLTSYFVLNIF